MVLHNPNNWHWVNKDVTTWTKEYLEKDLTGIKAEADGGASAVVSKLLSQEGDCEVAQSKGKVITIFDLKLQLEYTGEPFSLLEPIQHLSDMLPGKTKDGEDVSGTISIPEVAHDTDEDDYVVRLAPTSPRSPTSLVSLLTVFPHSSRLRCTPNPPQRLPSRTLSSHKSPPSYVPGFSKLLPP